MPSQTVREICTDAYREIGVLGLADTMDGDMSDFALKRFQLQLDAWQASRLTFALQTRTTFVVASGGTGYVTIGASGADVTLDRPTAIDAVTYLVPGVTPIVESQPLGQMTPAQFAQLSMKTLTSGLPTQWFYQLSVATALGTLYLWPVVNQSVTIAIYTPTPVGIPASLSSSLIAPPGYAEAFLYALAVRLCGPYGRPGDVLARVSEMANRAWLTMTRLNVHPDMLSLDPALVGLGAGYNVYTDQG